MAEFSPVKVDLIEQRADDVRVGHLLAKSVTAHAKVALLGFPCDDGVAINRGRVGAKAAPATIRQFLYRMTPDARVEPAFTQLLSKTIDQGDLVLNGNLENKQKVLGQQVAEHLKRGTVPIVLGGGHETTYGHFLGYVQAQQAVHLLNLDAHPDVRPRVNGESHSGSSFRDALEHSSGLCKGYTVFGLQPQSVSSAHYSYLQNKNCLCVFRPESSLERGKQIIKNLSGPTLMSIDIDVIDQSSAPGVSSPNPDGLEAAVLYELAFEAGVNKNVLSLDIVEVNPSFDVDSKTARVAALIVWHFLRGMTHR